jgi:hypothetical protein
MPREIHFLKERQIEAHVLPIAVDHGPLQPACTKEVVALFHATC